MDQKTLQALKEQLEKKKEQVIGELKNIGEPADGENNFNASFPDYGDSQEDNAAEVDKYNTNLSLEHSLEKGLDDIETALKKIEDGSYGVCKYCGHNIEPERLKVRPESTACIECKRKLKGGE